MDKKNSEITNPESGNLSSYTPKIKNSAQSMDFIHGSAHTEGKLFVFVIPILLFLVLGLGLFNRQQNNFYNFDFSGFTESGDVQFSKSQSKFNILSQEDLSRGIKDTVYTSFNCWLELRIDQQMLYQHFRDGKVNSYPISSGNKYLSKGVDSRPGLFTIFFKTTHHQSTQFNNADMYHFMPFNQGIGFHSLDGTGYYGNLGKAPSSHGCIRMRHQDAQKIFNDCPLGTLVLASRGYSSRAVDFAPEDFKNDTEFSKDEYKTMLAANLYNILEGKYYISERKFFVVNPEIIPKSGIYIAYDKQIPEKQLLPKGTYRFIQINDRLSNDKSIYRFEISLQDSTEIDSDIEEIDSSDSTSEDLYVTNVEKEIPMPKDELIKQFFSNPIGVLPYFPPDNK